MNWKWWIIIVLLVAIFAFILSVPWGTRVPCAHGVYDPCRISNLSEIQYILAKYKYNCGVYPGGVPRTGSDPRCAGVSRPSQINGSWLKLTSGIPKDLMRKTDYAYCYAKGEDSYVLQATLDNFQFFAHGYAAITPPADCENTVGIVTCDSTKGEYCVTTNPTDEANEMFTIATQYQIEKAGSPLVAVDKEVSLGAYYDPSGPAMGPESGVTSSRTYADVADPEHFQVLRPRTYARDNKYGYHGTFYVSSSTPDQPIWEPIPGSDGQTFKYLDGPYATDKNFVYLITLNNVFAFSREPQSFTILRSGWLPVGSYGRLEIGIAKDANNVYLENQSIPGADPTTFTIINNPGYYGLAKDKNYFYIVVPHPNYDSETKLYRLPLSEVSDPTLLR